MKEFDLTFGDQITIVLMATLASIGAAGVPGVGIFTLAMVLLAGLREESELSDIPALIKGTAMNLIIAGVLSMAFMGFAGLFSST